MHVFLPAVDSDINYNYQTVIITIIHLLLNIVIDSAVGCAAGGCLVFFSVSFIRPVPNTVTAASNSC